MQIQVAFDGLAGSPEGPFAGAAGISGTVTIHMEYKTKLSAILVSVKGIQRATLLGKKWRSSEDAFPGVSESETVLQIDKDLLSLTQIESGSKGAISYQGTHQFPFEISYKELLDYHNFNYGHFPVDTVLPPSFDFQAPNHEGSARIEYWLRATVKPSQKFELRFRPVGPLQPAATPAMTEVAGYGWHVSLNVSLPSQAILTISRHLPLQISLNTEARPFDDRLPLVIRSLKIIIRARTSITLQCGAAAWTETHQLLDISGLSIPVEAGRRTQTLSSELWRDALVPDIPPSFSTSIVQRQNSLVLRTGYSWGNVDDIHIIETLADVDVCPDSHLLPDWVLGARRRSSTSILT
ncbi:hypothetical protein H2198_006030 [Neophaeococcomyces mojaviensis]|uniref:Uncharacterized protein n=1 Tax=Neophaeococcomyces mojaviensis TaxID=3383035 RepID=A0ACC3A4F4_9EURO|nr:hypothetical protein H2198_006030 [Knufia sp. JES_112]